MINKGFLQLININKTYDDGYVACDNINISIDRGEFVTILGPSGCGKTTLLKMIAGFEVPTKGKILVNNIDIKNLAIHQRPTATVFQDYALFPNMNVYENILYGLKIMRKKLDNIPASTQKELIKISKAATKKAVTEIRKVEIKKRAIDRELIKFNKKYQKNNSIAIIQNMRYSQFQTQVANIEKQMKKRYGPDAEFKFTLKNKIIMYLNQVQRFLWLGNVIPKFDTSGMNEYQIMIYDLIKLYLYKQPFDKRIDSLSYEYNELDQEVSYWSNYPVLAREEFEKQNMSRLLTKDEISKKAKETIKLVGLEGKEKKYPNELSGGMQQRVALARAIVVEPQILLLDEPLSALDAKVRQQMQQELKRLHNELGLTFILITHDQEEALSLSNKVIVMSKGKIEQIDKPKIIYEHPANEWIANFIGKANILDGIFLGETCFSVYGRRFDYHFDAFKYKIKIGGKFKLLIRPEDIKVCPIEQAYFKAKIETITYKGMMFDIKCSIGNQTIFFETIVSFKVGETIGITWNFKDAHVIAPKKGE